MIMCWRSVLAPVTCTILCAQPPLALAEKTADNLPVLRSGISKVQVDAVQVADFWDWLKENSKPDYPGDGSRDRGGGGGSDGGAGGSGSGSGSGGGSGGDSGDSGGHG